MTLYNICLSKRQPALKFHFGVLSCSQPESMGILKKPSPIIHPHHSPLMHHAYDPFQAHRHGVWYGSAETMVLPTESSATSTKTSPL